MQVRRRGALQARGHALAPGHGRRDHAPKGDFALTASDCGMITGTKNSRTLQEGPITFEVCTGAWNRV